ncbi:CdaR family protein [Niallia alba]|jgi:YbbR domain-containing protein|uniref:YbbR-like domain-containing protein n=2 Tax=Niallia TaxID=2837506 RepID=A0A941GG61_NIACI|nr:MULTISPECIES: CdaR family protein [Niallia]EOR25840.1 YbbR family protein [Niallia nealsonii AAU1]MCB5239789.1 YbbR-like domain-containing protein [Niallia circulans]MDU1848368.1 CdaR family protein [Niallia nealsonii]MED3795343.1 CdaR family protein [Niallia alba]
MNKLFNNVIGKNWFTKVLSLAFALLLFSYAYDPNESSTDVNVPGDSETANLEDIPVTAYYDTENVVVTGIPKTVTVTLRGPTVHIQQAKLKKDFEVYVNLANADLGSKTVPLEIKDLSDKIKATIDPETIKVTVKEKVTKEFTVEAEFSSNAIEKGYSAGTPKIEPKTVKVTGAKDEIEKIAYVKANVNLNENTNEAVSQQAKVSVLDSSLNKLNVQVEPETVEVNIPVKRTSKTVPINIVEQGTPPANINIDSITLDKKEATISGPEDVLKEVESTRVEVDLSTIEKDEELTLPVIISNGVTSVDPELVKVTVKVTVAQEEQEEEQEEDPQENQDSEETAATEKTETRMISSIPINIQGLNSSLEASIKNPRSSSTSLRISGEQNRVREMSISDFNLYIDLTGMDDGEHEVPIKVNGPADIDWELAIDTASVSITNKEA